MKACCELGNEYSGTKRILYETDNFFITPTLGALGIEGYVLVCSKDHYWGVSDLPARLIPELELLLVHAKAVLSKAYKSEILIFEHGPKLECKEGNSKVTLSGGGCIQHCHLHLVPTSIDIIKAIDDRQRMLSRGYRLLASSLNEFSIRFLPVNSLSELANISKEVAYIYLELQDQRRGVIRIDKSLPSQFIRQIIACQRGIIFPNHDWAVDPDLSTFQNTLQDLQGKF